MNYFRGYYAIIYYIFYMFIHTFCDKLNIQYQQSNNDVHIKLEPNKMFGRMLQSKALVHCDDKLLPQSADRATGATISVTTSLLSLFFRNTVEK